MEPWDRAAVCCSFAPSDVRELDRLSLGQETLSVMRLLPPFLLRLPSVSPTLSSAIPVGICAFKPRVALIVKIVLLHILMPCNIDRHIHNISYAAPGAPKLLAVHVPDALPWHLVPLSSWQFMCPMLCHGTRCP